MAKVKTSEKSEPEVPVVRTPESTDVNGPVDFPQVRGTGKFQSVKVGDGYAVYNPDGVRVSGVMKMFEANDIVLRQNVAGHL